MRRSLPILGSSQSGFSLIEMAIVLMILGIIGGMSLHLFTAQLHRAAYLKTRENQEYALTAIAAFVEKNRRFPCPADPKAMGLEYGIEPKERKCPTAKAEGILPFRTLGISEVFAKDGFKRWMTYVIDSNLADKDNEDYMETVVGKQITLLTEQDLPIIADQSSRIPNFVAFLLISHGESGGGAFLGNGKSGRITILSPSSQKRENQDGNFVFIESPYTDDLIRWESRDHFLKHYVRWKK